MKKSMKSLYILILFISLAVFFSVVHAVGILGYPSSIVGSINYYRPATIGGSTPGQSISLGWRNFGSENFDIFTPEYCRTISFPPIRGGTGEEASIFIPTRSLAEWDSFVNRQQDDLSITISSCVDGDGCDINSGPKDVCLGEGATFANECEMMLAGSIIPSSGVCACNPVSGPIIAGTTCVPGKIECPQVIVCETYSDECAAVASGAFFHASCAM